MDTKLSHLRKSLQSEALKGKKMAARRLGEDSWNGLQPEPGRGSEHFGICGARIWALVRARDGWFQGKWCKRR